MIVEIFPDGDGALRVRTRYCTYTVEEEDGEITLSAPGVSRTVFVSEFPTEDLRAIAAFLVVSLESTIWGNA